MSRACEEIGYAAAKERHTLLLADDHVSSIDLYLARGASRFAHEHPESAVLIETNRVEGSPPIFEDLAPNVSVESRFYQELDLRIYGHGSLIPCLEALDRSDVLITVGGKLTVRLMGNIAADREKPVLAVPLFAGESALLYERLKWLYKSASKESGAQLSVLQSVWSKDSGERLISLANLLAGKNAATSLPSIQSYFISYKWDESDVADHIEVLLQRNQRVVNRDESMFAAGSDLSDVVQSLIQQSDTFIALWSARYKESTWCPQELAYALERQANGLKPNRVVLIDLDGTEVPIRFTEKLRLTGEDRGSRELAIRKLVEDEIEHQSTC